MDALGDRGVAGSIPAVSANTVVYSLTKNNEGKMNESLHTLHLTVGELIIIREALRKLHNGYMRTMYAPDITNTDYKVTEQLAQIFDQQWNKK